MASQLEDQDMLGPILAAAMLLGPAAEAFPIDVGRADWNALPALKAVQREMPTPRMVGRVQEMLASGQCTLPNQRAGKFDITVPYAVLVDPDGRVQRAVVADAGCPALETYVGRIILTMAEKGDFQPTGEVRTRWFASTFNFNLSP
ncbi:MAG TPA: hypothetical protein VFQ67_11640 [Allosphingosinicella sp.]|jgi:hypothetical protein|nr:hypothetical protein [Allosphingosinicella sp.]